MAKRGKASSPNQKKKYSIQPAITLQNKARNIARAKRQEEKAKTKKLKRTIT